MSEVKSLEKIKKFWPKEAPDINNIPKYIEKYKEELIVIKYGGNVLIDRKIFNNFIEDITILNKLGLSIIVVHGGGPRIERELHKENIQTKLSTFHLQSIEKAKEHHPSAPTNHSNKKRD